MFNTGIAIRICFLQDNANDIFFNAMGPLQDAISTEKILLDSKRGRDWKQSGYIFQKANILSFQWPIALFATQQRVFCTMWSYSTKNTLSQIWDPCAASCPQAQARPYRLKHVTPMISGLLIRTLRGLYKVSIIERGSRYVTLPW